MGTTAAAVVLDESQSPGLFQYTVETVDVLWMYASAVVGNIIVNTMLFLSPTQALSQKQFTLAAHPCEPYWR